MLIFQCDSRWEARYGTTHEPRWDRVGTGQSILEGGTKRFIFSIFATELFKIGNRDDAPLDSSGKTSTELDGMPRLALFRPYLVPDVKRILAFAYRGVAVAKEIRVHAQIVEMLSFITKMLSNWSSPPILMSKGFEAVLPGGR